MLSRFFKVFYDQWFNISIRSYKVRAIGVNDWLFWESLKFVAVSPIFSCNGVRKLFSHLNYKSMHWQLRGTIRLPSFNSCCLTISLMGKCCCTVLVNLSFFPYRLSTTLNIRFQLRVVSKITQSRRVESTLENWSMFQNLVQVSVSRRSFVFQAADEIFSPKSIKEVLASISMYNWVSLV